MSSEIDGNLFSICRNDAFLDALFSTYDYCLVSITLPVTLLDCASVHMSAKLLRWNHPW